MLCPKVTDLVNGWLQATAFSKAQISLGEGGGSRGGARPGAAGLDLGRQHTAPPSPARHYRAENAESPGFSGSSRGFVHKSGESYTAWAGPVLTGDSRGSRAPSEGHAPSTGLRHAPSPTPVGSFPSQSAELSFTPAWSWLQGNPEWVKNTRTVYTPFLHACCQDSLVCSPGFSWTPSDLLCSIQPLNTPNILHPPRTQDPVLYRQPDDGNQTKKKSQRSWD